MSVTATLVVNAQQFPLTGRQSVAPSPARPATGEAPDRTHRPLATRCRTLPVAPVSLKNRPLAHPVTASTHEVSKETGSGARYRVSQSTSREGRNSPRTFSEKSRARPAFAGACWNTRQPRC